jgi:hypothetical protein
MKGVDVMPKDPNKDDETSPDRARAAPADTLESSAASPDAEFDRQVADRLLVKAEQVERVAQMVQEDNRRMAHAAELERAVDRMDAQLSRMQAAPADHSAAALGYPAGHAGACGKETCVSPACCEMEFVFKRVRMTSGQTGTDAVYDSETTTGLAGAKLGMEMLFYASLEGVGIIVPNQIWGAMRISKRKKRPGVWYEIDRVINRVSVPCGTTKTYPYVLQAIEKEIGLAENAAGGMDEFGLVEGEVRLSCSCDPVYVTVPIPLDGGGAGGGELEVIFEIRRVT